MEMVLRVHFNVIPQRPNEPETIRVRTENRPDIYLVQRRRVGFM